MAELFEMDNVVLSPHLTFYTDEAMARLVLDTASHGNTRTTVLKAFPREDFVKLIQSIG